MRYSWVQLVSQILEQDDNQLPYLDKIFLPEFQNMFGTLAPEVARLLDRSPRNRPDMYEVVVAFRRLVRLPTHSGLSDNRFWYMLVTYE